MRKEIIILIILIISCNTVLAATTTRYGSDFTIFNNKISFKISDRLGTERLSFNSNNLSSRRLTWATSGAGHGCSQLRLRNQVKTVGSFQVSS